MGVTGLLDLGGTALSGALSAREAKRQRKWQEKMSNSAYQRSMTDMKKAGLNPILAYSQGGATTPPGAQALVPDYGRAASTAIKEKEQTQKKSLIDEQTEKLGSARRLDDAQTKRTNKETEILNSKVPRARVLGEFDEGVLAPAIDWLKNWMGETFSAKETKKATETKSPMGFEQSGRRQMQNPKGNNK